MNPVVSVIMPCYNMEKYIGDAVNSILKQTFKHFELIIIDDGSTDHSLELAYALKKMDERIIIVENSRNRGIGYSRNRGIRESRGRYIALMDADDIAYADRLEQQVSILESDNNIDAISGYYDLLTENGEEENLAPLYGYNNREVAIRLLFHCIIADSSTMCRKNVLTKNCITFPENYRAVGAYKFWCEFVLHGSIVVLPRKYYQYRINKEGLTQVTKKNNLEERYEWHNRIHDYYWKEQGIELTNREKVILFDATNGRHLHKLTQLIFLKRVLKRFYKKYAEKNAILDSQYLKKACAELLHSELLYYAAGKYHRIKGIK